MDIQSIIEKLEKLASTIKTGEANLDDLESFSDLSRILSERAVILKYKAYEEKVFGAKSDIADLASETLIEEKSVEEPKETTIIEEPILELTANEAEDNDDQSFDLFSFDEPQEAVKEVELEVVSKQIEEPAFIEEEKEEVSMENVQSISNIVDALKEELVPQNTQSIVMDEVILKEPEIIKVQTEQTGDLHPIYSKVNYNDNSLAARLNNSKIESLQGAFSLSESVQIINELFGRSNDDFSDALKALNVLNSRNEARVSVSQYANRYNWNVNSEVALAFIQKIDRRYA